jgi:antitoxin component of RelBE/YafQ-DinJ toxin-antitoxin module
MKSRLNITIDDALAEQAKNYARKNGTSVSNLIEQYFRSVISASNKKNILDLLNELPPTSSSVEEDWKENYYSHNRKKYGF